jgi:hypothetical protein
MLVIVQTPVTSVNEKKLSLLTTYNHSVCSGSETIEIVTRGQKLTRPVIVQNAKNAAHPNRNPWLPVRALDSGVVWRGGGPARSSRLALSSRFMRFFRRERWPDMGGDEVTMDLESHGRRNAARMLAGPGRVARKQRCDVRRPMPAVG